MKLPIPATVTLETHTAIAPLLRGMFSPSRLGAHLGTEPDPAALERASSAFRAELIAAAQERAELLRQSMERSLIEGVTLGAVELEVQEELLIARTRFDLEDLRKLPLIRVSFEPGLPRERPFEHFRVTELRDELRLTGTLESVGLPQGAAFTERVGGLGLWIELPRPVRSSNAHRADPASPTRLEWFFDAARWADEAPRIEASW